MEQLLPSEVTEILRERDGTRNGIGARLKIDLLSDPLIVVQSRSDHLDVVPDNHRDKQRAYRIWISVWNDYYQRDVNMLRRLPSGDSIGLIKSVQWLDGYEVSSLERDYGVEGMYSGKLAPPQFYKRQVKL